MKDSSLSLQLLKRIYNKMEIAMFVWEFPPRLVGGLGTYASEIAPQFVKMGNDVTILTLNEGNLTTRDIWNGVEVHRPEIVSLLNAIPNVLIEDIRKHGTDAGFFSNILAYNILSASKLVNDIAKREERAFDIVVSHDWLSITGGIAAKKGLNKPFVLHFHSTEKGRTLGGGSPMISELEYQGGQSADLVITVSSSMRDELVSQGFPEKKIRVCANGVDAQKYDPKTIKKEEADKIRSKYGVQEKDPMILFVGRLTSIKGVDRLVMAMPSILKKTPNAKLVIVGIGDMERHLTNLISTLNLRNSVKTRFEFISEEERIQHYAASDICAFPSLYEPFGIVCIEAMSMGKPVVVGAAGSSGMRDIVVHSGPDQCGFHI
ncbi:MAG: glycogen synthase, partial [Thermoproteota archaeon]|nr:glycogen synthase [Thermoproteota archaeon]